MPKPIATIMQLVPMPAGLRWRIASMSGRYSAADGPAQAVTRMREGFRMSLDRRAFVERTMYYSGIYNPWLTHAFKRILRPGDTMVDGGANIGYFSLLAAKCVGPSGAVHAFEPIPATFALLSDNLKLNSFPNAHANRVALGAEAGQAVFEMPQEADTNLALNRLATVVVTGRGEQITVRVRTFDDYVAAERVGHIRLVKLDIEGGEVSAIKGMRQTLLNHQIDYFICEVNVPLLEKQGLKASAIRDALAEFGYEAYLIRGFGSFRRPLRVAFVPNEQLPQPDTYGDYLFVAPGVPLPKMHG